MKWLDSITDSKNESEQTLGDSGGERNLEIGKENAYMLAFLGPFYWLDVQEHFMDKIWDSYWNETTENCFKLEHWSINRSRDHVKYEIYFTESNEELKCHQAVW